MTLDVILSTKRKDIISSSKTCVRRISSIAGDSSGADGSLLTGNGNPALRMTWKAALNELRNVSYVLTLLTLTSLPNLSAQEPISRIEINKDIELLQIKDSIFVHTSWTESADLGRFPSNGIVCVKSGKAVLIDTPFTPEQTRELYCYLADSMAIRITKVICGHCHPDCVGGLQFLHEQGVESYAGKLTRQKCIEQQLPVPLNAFSDELAMDFGGKQLICRYFGPGHTADNIVVYFPQHKILFGGCLIRSANSTSLGYTKEAVLSEWDHTVEKIAEAYPGVETVVPGHGKYGDKRLLAKTIELVRNARE